MRAAAVEYKSTQVREIMLGESVTKRYDEVRGRETMNIYISDQDLLFPGFPNRFLIN